MNVLRNALFSAIVLSFLGAPTSGSCDETLSKPVFDESIEQNANDFTDEAIEFCTEEFSDLCAPAACSCTDFDSGSAVDMQSQRSSFSSAAAWGRGDPWNIIAAILKWCKKADPPPSVNYKMPDLNRIRTLLDQALPNLTDNQVRRFIDALKEPCKDGAEFVLIDMRDRLLPRINELLLILKNSNPLDPPKEVLEELAVLHPLVMKIQAALETIYKQAKWCRDNPGAVISN